MNSPWTAEKVKFGIVACITLVCINLWSFQLLDESTYRTLEAVIYLLLVSIVIYNTNVFANKQLRFKTTTLLFLLLPLLSVVGANIYHNQPIHLSLLLLRVNLVWLLYFVLHIFNIPPKRIIQLLVFIGCVWAFLTIIQQITYPYYYFYTRSDETKSIYRAGVYRYMITGEQYGVFVLLYFFYRYTTTSKLYNLIFVVFMLGGLYYFGTRQYLAAAMACLFLSLFLLHGLSKWKYLLLFSVAASVVFLFSSSLFGEMIEMTTDQLDNEDYIRFRAAGFFLNEYWPSWGAKLLGNGRAHEASAYGVEMDLYKAAGYFRSDVGIIGIYNEFGVFYILNVVVLILRGIFLKIREKSDKYLKLFFFYFGLLLFLSLGFSYSSAIPFYCFVLYLIDASLYRKDSVEEQFDVNPVRKEKALIANMYER